ncbi:hypothetical protein BKA70DRAFT_1414232 [Coprinopsis sp. MPI-PUGE-AT-0042]|nr:hypothetical protein BKA70DRAFT_1414232 [Coprinopsis sp. MPI-PUGE-AT-0042]
MAKHGPGYVVESRDRNGETHKATFVDRRGPRQKLAKFRRNGSLERVPGSGHGRHCARRGGEPIKGETFSESRNLQVRMAVDPFLKDNRISSGPASCEGAMCRKMGLDDAGHLSVVAKKKTAGLWTVESIQSGMISMKGNGGTNWYGNKTLESLMPWEVSRVGILRGRLGIETGELYTRLSTLASFYNQYISVGTPIWTHSPPGHKVNGRRTSHHILPVPHYQDQLLLDASAYPGQPTAASQICLPTVKQIAPEKWKLRALNWPICGLSMQEICLSHVRVSLAQRNSLRAFILQDQKTLVLSRTRGNSQWLDLNSRKKHSGRSLLEEGDARSATPHLFQRPLLLPTVPLMPSTIPSRSFQPSTSTEIESPSIIYQRKRSQPRLACRSLSLDARPGIGLHRKRASNISRSALPATTMEDPLPLTSQPPWVRRAHAPPVSQPTPSAIQTHRSTYNLLESITLAEEPQELPWLQDWAQIRPFLSVLYDGPMRVTIGPSVETTSRLLWRYQGYGTYVISVRALFIPFRCCRLSIPRQRQPFLVLCLQTNPRLEPTPRMTHFSASHAYPIPHRIFPLFPESAYLRKLTWKLGTVVMASSKLLDMLEMRCPNLFQVGGGCDEAKDVSNSIVHELVRRSTDANSEKESSKPRMRLNFGSVIGYRKTVVRAPSGEQAATGEYAEAHRAGKGWGSWDSIRDISLESKGFPPNHRWSLIPSMRRAIGRSFIVASTAICPSQAGSMSQLVKADDIYASLTISVLYLGSTRVLFSAVKSGRRDRSTAWAWQAVAPALLSRRGPPYLDLEHYPSLDLLEGGGCRGVNVLEILAIRSWDNQTQHQSSRDWFQVESYLTRMVHRTSSTWAANLLDSKAFEWRGDKALKLGEAREILDSRPPMGVAEGAGRGGGSQRPCEEEEDGARIAAFGWPWSCNTNVGGLA